MKRTHLALLVVALAMAGQTAMAAEPVTPPAIYPPDTWEGRSGAVVRVLDKLDAHVEMLVIPAGQSSSYKSLNVAVRSCLQHPPGLSPDNAANLTVQDGHAEAKPFNAWMFSAEPFVSVFESPVYGVQLVSCSGTSVAPAAPLLLPPPTAVTATPDPNAVPDAGTDPGNNAVYPSGAPDPSQAPAENPAAPSD